MPRRDQVALAEREAPAKRRGLGQCHEIVHRTLEGGLLVLLVDDENQIDVVVSLKIRL